MQTQQPYQDLDPESEGFLQLLSKQEAVKLYRVAGVRTVLVVLSAKAMVYDTESLRQKILLSYPEAAIFFLTPLGKPVGANAPFQVDLVIDFTGPGQRGKWFHANKLRRMARVTVGRNAGLFRKKIYDRVFDEKDPKIAQELSKDPFLLERFVQKKVLELAGVTLFQQGDVLNDRSGVIALELPPLSRI